MSVEEDKGIPKIEADKGSIASAFQAGNIDNSNIHINNTINNYDSPDPALSPFLNESIETDSFEPETILIPEGLFWMGSDPSDGIPLYETTRHEINLPVYRISKNLVTNSQYHKFVVQGGPINTEMDWEGRKYRQGCENTPVTGVKLEDARKYCEWLSRASGRNYTIPNEAQLEKAYNGSYGCSDDNGPIYQWTNTLWGQKANAPDPKYYYPWTDNDERNNLNANSQIRRVVCVYSRQDGADVPRARQRYGKFPWDVGFPYAWHGFRVVMIP
jgi:formylglycine-generating enzyme required for sulfatase activity